MPPRSPRPRGIVGRTVKLYVAVGTAFSLGLIMQTISIMAQGGDASQALSLTLGTSGVAALAAGCAVAVIAAARFSGDRPTVGAAAIEVGVGATLGHAVLVVMGFAASTVALGLAVPGLELTIHVEALVLGVSLTAPSVGLAGALAAAVLHDRAAPGAPSTAFARGDAAELVPVRPTHAASATPSCAACGAPTPVGAAACARCGAARAAR